MITSVVECPHCRYRFNYEFLPGISFSSIRLGTQRIFTCPSCKELHRFDITHVGEDPLLLTHGDNAETSMGAKRIAIMLGPLLVFTAAGILLLITGALDDVLVGILLPLVGIAWVFVYVAYLYRRADQNTQAATREAK